MTPEQLRERARAEAAKAPTPIPLAAQQAVIALVRPHMPQQASTRKTRRVNAA